MTGASATSGRWHPVRRAPSELTSCESFDHSSTLFSVARTEDGERPPAPSSLPKIGIEILETEPELPSLNPSLLASLASIARSTLPSGFGLRYSRDRGRG